MLCLVVYSSKYRRVYAFTLTYAPLPFYPVRSVSDLRHLCTQQLNHTPNVHSFLLNVALTQGHTHRFLSPEATVSDLISFIRYKVRVLCLSLFDQVVFVDFWAFGLEELGFHMARVISQWDT